MSSTDACCGFLGPLLTKVGHGLVYHGDVVHIWLDWADAVHCKRSNFVSLTSWSGCVHEQDTHAEAPPRRRHCTQLPASFCCLISWAGLHLLWKIMIRRTCHGRKDAKFYMQSSVWFIVPSASSACSNPHKSMRERERDRLLTVKCLCVGVHEPFLHSLLKISTVQGRMEYGWWEYSTKKAKSFFPRFLAENSAWLTTLRGKIWCFCNKQHSALPVRRTGITML